MRYASSDSLLTVLPLTTTSGLDCWSVLCRLLSPRPFLYLFHALVHHAGFHAWWISLHLYHLPPILTLRPAAANATGPPPRFLQHGALSSKAKVMGTCALLGTPSHVTAYAVPFFQFASHRMLRHVFLLRGIAKTQGVFLLVTIALLLLFCALIMGE
eukprot:RCo007414